MTQPGPRRLPTAVKVARGTYEASKQGNPAAEPQSAPLAKLPMAPRHLKVAGKKKWKDIGARLIEMRLLSGHDVESFVLLCETFDEKVYLEAKIKKEGDYVHCNNGRIFSHPAIAQREKLLKRQQTLFAQFGMSPSARAAIRIPAPKTQRLKVRNRA